MAEDATRPMATVVTGALGLRARLLVWFLVMAASAVGAAVFVSVHVMRTEVVERVDRELGAEAARVHGLLDDQPDSGSMKGAASLAQLVRTHEPSPGVAVVAWWGDEVVSSRATDTIVEEVTRRVAAAELPLRLSGFHTVSVAGHRYRALTVPVSAGSGSGSYVLLRSLDVASAAVDDATDRLVGAALLVLLAAGLVASGVISRTLRPVRVLSRAVRHTSDDALDERIVVRGRDEVAQLARSFNAMLDRLDSGIRARDEDARHLRHAATHDPLTRTKNRLAFYRALDRTGARGPGDLQAVLVIDLDGFKAVNDDFGHATGDAVLVEVAARIEDLVRPHDTFARLGGDEFALLCERLVGPEEAVAIARRVHQAVARPVPVGRREVAVSASVGVACSSRREQIRELLGRADRAMYHAKRHRLGVVVWQPGRAARGSGRVVRPPWPMAG